VTDAVVLTVLMVQQVLRCWSAGVPWCALSTGTLSTGGTTAKRPHQHVWHLLHLPHVQHHL
jgi:hypothetical protein